MAKADYEGRLLGSLIKSNNQIPLIRSLLSEKDFQSIEYRDIFKIISTAYSEKGLVDAIVLADLAPDAKTEAVLDKLISLPALSEDKVKNYAEEVRRRRRLQRLSDMGAYIQNGVKNVSDFTSDEKLDKFLVGLYTGLFDIAGDSTFIRPTKDDVLQEMMDDIKLYEGQELQGFDTGWDTLNKISRGISPQKFWVIGAYTSVGKSWACLKLAQNMAVMGTKVLYISTEMSEKSLLWRLATLISGKSEYELMFKKADMFENQKRRDILRDIKRMPLEVVSGIGNIDECLFEIRKAKARGAVDVVFVDFLQNLSEDEEVKSLSVAVKKLQNIALKENIAIVAASQNNRESQKSEYESLRGFKGSGTIETAADIAIILSRVKDHKKERMIADVQKNRSGVLGKFRLDIDFATGKMEDVGFCDDKGDLISE